MKKLLFALMAGLAIFACSPAEYDDTAIKEQIDNLDDRLTKVEEDLATLELNVNALKSLSEALKTGKYVETVAALEDGTGYTITFSDGESIIVKHGVKGETGDKGDKGDKGDTGDAGKDGVTPTVTVKEVDGVLYWFINGEQGKPLYEEAPKFTSVDGNLYVTYPGGEPQFIGALTGVSIFKSVVVNEEEGTVTFTFVGENGEAGETMVLPLAVKFALEINTTVGLAKDQTEVEIPYTVKGANETTVVDVIAVACEAVVEKEVIKVSKIAEGSQLLVFADNGEGKTSIRKVVFAAENYSVEAVAEVIPAEGGQVVVKGISNVAFDVVIPAEATWLTQVVAKSAFELTFAAEANEAYEVRSAEVNFVRQGTEEVLMSVTIAQAAGIAPFAELVKAFQSHGADSYMAALGGSAGKDRNIAINDEYLFIPETQGSPVMWKVSLADGAAVKMPVGTVVGTNVTFAMSCPRFLKNTDETINGGKDVLVVSSMGMGGQEGYLYFYNNGLEADPHKVALNLPGAGGRRIGDKMSVYGTMQNWGIYYKEQGSSAIINYGGTYKVLGVDNIWAAGRTYMDPTSDGQLGGIYFYDKATAGVKGLITTVENGKYGVLDSNVTYDQNGTVSAMPVFVAQQWSNDPKLAGCHGFNFFKHNEKDYIAYTNFPAKKLVIIEGAANADGVQAALEAHKVVFEASIAADDNACTSGNSGADCSVYQKDGKTYVAGHIQNVGVVVYKLN